LTDDDWLAWNLQSSDALDPAPDFVSKMTHGWLLSVRFRLLSVLVASIPVVINSSSEIFSALAVSDYQRAESQMIGILLQSLAYDAFS
jgi:hypothetical protein